MTKDSRKEYFLPVWALCCGKVEHGSCCVEQHSWHPIINTSLDPYKAATKKQYIVILWSRGTTTEKMSFLKTFDSTDCQSKLVIYFIRSRDRRSLDNLLTKPQPSIWVVTSDWCKVTKRNIKQTVSPTKTIFNSCKTVC